MHLRYQEELNLYLQRRILNFFFNILYSENFTVRNVKYPSKVIGDIAPGMSLIMNISFCAPSFADFDD
jgi:hypothetical protein